jgi:uncharacterized membrane protein
MIRAAQSIFVSALGLWVGGMATLAFIVAPATFRTAPSRAVAGSIFGSILQSFGSVQIVLALLCVASLIVLTLKGGLRGRNGLLRIATVSIMLALVLVSQFHVAPAIARERETIPNFDALPPGVPQKAPEGERLRAVHHRVEVRPLGHHLEAPIALSRQRLQRLARRDSPHEGHGVDAYAQRRSIRGPGHFATPSTDV